MPRADDFTTFINVADDPNLERKFDRLAQVGSRAFGSIQTAATQATQAAANMLQGGAGGLSGGTLSGLDRQAAQARNLTRASLEAARAAPAASAAIARTGRDAEISARQYDGLARSLRTTSEALQVVQGPLGPLAGRVRAAATALTSLTGFQLGAAGAGALAFAIARVGVQYQTLEGRLRPYFSTQKDVNSAMSQIAVIAKDSRAALEPVADLYTKLTLSAAQYGFTQAQVARLTKTATQAATLSGGTAASREAGLYQFSQAIGSNRLGGDELRSVLENIPALAQAIAQGLGLTVGQLRQLGAQGALTATEVAAALDRSASTVEKRFSKLPVTLSTAATEFKNAMEITVGQFDQAIGLSSGLASVLSAVAGNLHEILSLAAGVGGAFAVIRVGNWAQGLGAAIAKSREFETVGIAIATATRAQAAEEARLAAVRAESAAVSLAGSQRYVTQLENEIALTAAFRNEQLALMTQGPFAGTGGATSFNRAAYNAARVAEQESLGQLKVLTADLTRAKLAEAEASRIQTLAASQSAAAQTVLSGAVTTTTGRTSLFKVVAGNLVGLLNPWLLGITAITTGLIYLATAQSDSERATDRAKNAMQDYANIVDEATGKVRNLTNAEQRRALGKAQETIRAYETGDPGNLEGTQGVGGRLGARLENYQGIDVEHREGSPELAAVQRRNQFLAGLARDLESNGDKAAHAMNRIFAEARGGDKDLQRFIDENKDLIERFRDLATAAQDAKKTVRLIGGGTDPDVAARKAAREAERAAQAAAVTRRVQRENARANSLDDNNKYQTNLTDIYAEYKPFGVLSPEDIATKRDQIGNLKRMPIQAGEEKARADTIKSLNEALDEGIRITSKYKGTIEELARARTKAQTAERDANKQERLENKEQRDAVLQAKALAETQLNRGLLALEKNRASMTPAQYVAQQQNLLQTYDRQIDALNERAGSSQKAVTREIADAKRLQKEYASADEKRSNILSRYNDEPKPVQRATRDISELTRLQKQLGEGFYPKAILQRDIANIQDGLQRPVREMLRDYERQREIQLLLLQGRQAEADALRQAYTLQDSVGQVTKATYEQLILNRRAEQDINDALASRERITSLITGAVDNARNALEQFLIDVRTDAPKAGSDLIRSIGQNFTRIQVRQFVEQITAGVDPKIRSMLEGQHTIDSATRVFASQIGTAADSSMTLAEANRRAAGIIVSTAEELQGSVERLISSAERSGATTGVETAASAAQGAVQAIKRQEKMLAPIAASQRRLTSGFGFRTDPVSGGSEYHTGLDMAAAVGTAVHAAFSGRVSLAGPDGGYGNAIKVNSGGGLTELYGHLSKLNVKLGDLVERGAVIGFVGSTGHSTGNHLHFGTYLNGKPVDPNSVTTHLVSIGSLGASTPKSAGRASTGSFQDVVSDVAALPDTRIATGVANDAAALLAETLEKSRSISMAATVSALSISGGPLAQLIDKNQQDSAKAQPLLPKPGVGSARDYYNAMGSQVGSNLDKVFGTKFFKGIGGSFGTALEGAGKGAIASGFARALGIRQNGTGAAIGGAIGQLAAPFLGPLAPFAPFIGGLLGGTLGGLFKPSPKQAAATVSVGKFGNLTAGAATGNDQGSKTNATAQSNTLISSLNNIAKTLGGTIQGSASISLGYRASDPKQPYRVDPSGAGRASGAGVLAFATQEEAIQKAIQLMLEKGVIGGISAASQRILQSGQDLQTALEKATLIESIPKQLMQRTNPVLYAVTELNRQFVDVINTLKEAGATGQQFADAQKLYDLERADSIKQASQTIFGQIDDLMKQMTETSQSPLNKLTVYQNAQTELAKFVSDIQGGKIVDQGDLTNAARNFQDASKALNGSSQSFFTDFDYIYGLLSQAKTNAQNLSVAGGDGTALPASPFSTDKAVQDAIAAASGTQVDAINNQTDVLSGKLDTLIGLLGNGASGGGGSISALPAFSGGGFGGFSNRSVLERSDLA